jgi:hypothetical protein
LTSSPVPYNALYRSLLNLLALPLPVPVAEVGWREQLRLDAFFFCTWRLLNGSYRFDHSDQREVTCSQLCLPPSQLSNPSGHRQ